MLVVQPALHSRYVEDCSDARVPSFGDSGHAIDRSRLVATNFSLETSMPTHWLTTPQSRRTDKEPTDTVCIKA